MKFIPKVLDDNINAPQTNILKEFFYFLFVLIIIIIFIYILLGFIVDIIAEKIPPETEQLLAYNYIKIFETKKITEKEKLLQKFLNEIVKYSDLKGRKFKIRIMESNQVNALALPGGTIVILSGLLKTIKTENQLAYVLSHELGHYAHRDHLRGLGRILVLSLITTVLFGSDTFYNKSMANSINGIQLKYTRAQETRADLYAVDLLYKKYKNVAGATDLLSIFSKNEPMPKLISFFTTHPHYIDRINTIKSYIKKKGYKEIKDKQIKIKF
jgi:Zn-dependent protease with chaperone function